MPVVVMTPKGPNNKGNGFTPRSPGQQPRRQGDPPSNNASASMELAQQPQSAVLTDAVRATNAVGGRRQTPNAGAVGGRRSWAEWAAIKAELVRQIAEEEQLMAAARAEQPAAGVHPFRVHPDEDGEMTVSHPQPSRLLLFLLTPPSSDMPL
jgi:hypothetical protein